MTATAIATLYEGVMYRSRLEARWAVFLESLGVRALYEQEAYELADGTRYLPDFWLPALELFFEVKPMRPTREERRKCQLLADGTGRMVVLVIGAPGDWLERWPGSEREFGVAFYPTEGEDAPWLPCECRTCHAIGWAFEGRAARLPCGCDKAALRDRGHNADAERIVKAAAFANGINLGVR